MDGAVHRTVRYYYGEDWKAQISPSPATQAYVDVDRTPSPYSLFVFRRLEDAKGGRRTPSASSGFGSKLSDLC